MENGTYKYDLEMSTPLGKRRGNLELIVWKDFLNGYLTMFTRTFPIREGKLDGSNVAFSGEMKTLMNLLSYKAQGAANASGITLMIETNQGRYPVTGVLTEVRRD